MIYIKEDIEVMLRNHLKNESKITEIKLKQEEYEERLEFAGTVYEDTEEAVIEGMQLKRQVILDIPGSITNKVSDTTLNTVINYEKEINHVNKEDREELKRKIAKLKREKDTLDKLVVRVKNILYPLSTDEKYVITTYYMKKSKWDYVEREYFNNFEIHKSIKQLQTYRDNALDSMLKIVNAGE